MPRTRTTLVGVAEIESRYGITRMQISKLIRVGDFPEPVETLAAGRIWNLRDVERAMTSLRKQGRVKKDGRIVPRRFLERTA